MAETSTNKKEQERVTTRIVKILNSDKYYGRRNESVLSIKNLEENITQKPLVTALNKWVVAMIARKDNIDAGRVEYTPEMFEVHNKEKLLKVFPNIDRKDLLDRLNVINTLIPKVNKIDSDKFLAPLINTRYQVLDDHDMAIHWLEYFLKNSKVDVNCYKFGSLMGTAISHLNSDTPALLLSYGYKVTESDFEVLRNMFKEIEDDNNDMYEKEKALEALHEIEKLLTESLRK